MLVGWAGCKRLIFFPSLFLVSHSFVLNNLNIIFYNKYTGLNVNKTKYNHTDTEALLDYCFISKDFCWLFQGYISPHCSE